MSAILEQLRQRAHTAQQRVIFPETVDPRVQQALATITTEEICQPVIFKTESTISDCEVFWDRPDAENLLDEAAVLFAQKRKHKGLSEAEAKHILQDDPLLLATCLVASGYVDCGVGGSVATTSAMLRACLQGIGLAADAKLVSSTFLIDHSYRLMTYGDCGVNPDPNAEQLAYIAIDSARTHQQLSGEDPKVALLSFSTLGSAEAENLEKIRQAEKMAHDLAPDLAIDGELQADAALMPAVGKAKAAGSAVAGEANVLIFPDLNAGNIAYKLTERLGGAQAIGPILQGLDKPWVDLSRGCSSDDIVNAAAIASALCH